MKMVGHQAIIINAQMEPVSVTMKKLVKKPPVTVIRKNGISVVPPVENVVASGVRPILFSGKPGHGGHFQKSQKEGCPFTF
jgi:hypothetical protein